MLPVGWIVTFIIDERGGGPNSGYISAGFFGGWYLTMFAFIRLIRLIHLEGLTVGRMVLHYATRWIPERNTIFLYSALSITYAASSPVLRALIIQRRQVRTYDLAGPFINWKCY